MIPPIPTVRPFGRLPDGRSVDAWTLCGAGGLHLEVITYGGIVTKLAWMQRDGAAVDVVLGHDNLESYLKGHPYFGAIVGRVAGRLTGAKFSLDGRDYALPRNDPPNHLHGGLRGFDKHLWCATPIKRGDAAPCLQLSYTSVDGEEGYPGNVDVIVTYTITNDNVFKIETHATTDHSTPFSLTHHSYFNLGGAGSGSIANHILQVDSDFFVGTTDDLTLLDHTAPVDDTANDLRSPRLLAEVMPLFAHGHGALYVVRKPATAAELVLIATLTHPASGRVLTCSTTTPYMQLYTASAFDGSITGKSGKIYGRHAGICLECEDYANGANSPHMGDSILRPGKPQSHVTTYAFTSASHDATNHMPAMEGSSTL